ANTDDYIEIDNPFADSPDADQKIWVPRTSIQRGLPRGGDLVKSAFDKAVDASAVLDAGKPPAAVVRNRLLLAEAGEQKVGSILGTFLSRGIIVKSVTPPGNNEAATEPEQLAYIATITDQASGGPILFVSKPEGLKPGARIKGDLYDTRGPLLIRSFWVTVPKPAQGQSAEDALFSALKGLAQTAQSSLEWFPWYGRVISVSGERIYIDTGGESGLKVGQRLIVYRGGEIIAGIGFASGERITTFQITNYVGRNGSYGTSPQAANVKPGDYVELEK
ncbi:MAG: hypothetical protein WA003_00500, partial [Desulfuromonadaceae bacterium]